MIEQQEHHIDEQFQSCDDAYLAELTNRISKLRMLHETMESKPEPWGWLKTLSE